MALAFFDKNISCGKYISIVALKNRNCRISANQFNHIIIFIGLTVDKRYLRIIYRDLIASKNLLSLTPRQWASDTIKIIPTQHISIINLIIIYI